MLVTFYCDAHEDITMFGDVAIRLLAMMGHSGKIPGALLATEVPAALASLTDALASEPQKHVPIKPSSHDDEEEEAISITLRAQPLIQLLKDAIQADCDVLWR